MDLAMSTEEDKILVEQARVGSQRAFSALYNKYKRNLWWIIFKIVRNQDVADDLMAVTFAKAFTRLDTFVEHISFEMWLKTIAINSAIDYVRRNKKEKLNDYLDDDTKDNQPIQLEGLERSPEKEFTDKEDINVVTECMSKLRASYRLLLQLKLEGLTYKEIAKKLAMPEATVKGGLNKARQRLRELIDTY